MTRNIQTVFNRLLFNEMLRQLNHVMLNWMMNPGRDSRSMRLSTSADFLSTIKQSQDYQTVEEAETQINK